MPNESAKIILAVTHGKLTKVKDAFAVEGTINALKVGFQFRTPDWDNTTKTVVFVRGRATPATTNADTTYVMLDENNECYVPPEILNGSMFSVGVFGTYDDYRIVSNWMCYKITDGCYADGSTPIDPSSTIYEQIISILKNKSDVNHKHDERYYTKDQSNGKFLTEEDLPVTSVNQKTGDVVLNAEDVGAFANTVDEQGNQVQTIPYAAIKDAPAQIQSDWNQNDSHSVDYIKNRPFYSNITEALNLSLEDFTFYDDGTGMGYYTYECSEPMYVDFNLDTIHYYISGTTSSGKVFACNKTVNAYISEDGSLEDYNEYYYLTISRNSDNNLSIRLNESMSYPFKGALTFILSIGVIKQIPVEYIPVLQRPSENDNLPISAFYAGNLVEEKASELIDKVSSQIDKASSELRDYVLDERPCYAEYTKADVIALQTTNFSYSSNEDVYYGFCNDTNFLTTNTACKVLWDDVIYDVVSSSDNRGYPCYGDQNLVEYPFYFVIAVSEAAGRVNGYNIYTNSTATSHTFRVYTETLSKVKQLDIACIPEEVKSLGLTGTSVGQIIKVKEVDSSGRPIKWEAVEFPEQVQPDWEQSNETAVDYIKNRPFSKVGDGLSISSDGKLNADTKSLSMTGTTVGQVPVVKVVDESGRPIEWKAADKMDKENPTGTGSFSLNRRANSIVGDYSFAEGYNTAASGGYSHAEGRGTNASNSNSHAEGDSTQAASANQHVQGRYNIQDSSDTYADIIGNGTSDTERSNATTVDWSGNAWYAGDVYTGSTSGTNKDEGSKKLATEEYVDTEVSGGLPLGISGASVGQTVKIKAVDENGVPTEWEVAEQVQPDWNQNDETASDYIKNRPFGYYTIQDVILEEIPFTYKNTKEQTSISLIGSELIKSKSSIDVLTVVDEAFGEQYDLPKRTIPEYTIDEYSCIGFGNVSLVSSSSPDTGEKFLIGITGSDYVYVYRVVDESRVGTESSLTCLVSKPVGKKVDPDFLPTASSSKLGCGKVTVIDDSNTATKRNTKPIYIDSDGILYSGLTLPTSGSIGDIPVIKAIYYGDEYIYGRTTLGGFLDGVSSTNYYHQVSLDSSIRDIIFILTDRDNNLHKVTDLCLSIGNKDIVDISSEIGPNIGSDIKIHVQSIIKGYLSVKLYIGRVEREYNFLPYTLTSQPTSKILKLYSSGHTSFTCTTYYNKIV